MVVVISPCPSLTSSGEWSSDLRCSGESLQFAELSSSGEFYSPPERINAYQPPPRRFTALIRELSKGLEAPVNALDSQSWFDPLKAFCAAIKDLPLSKTRDCPYDDIRGVEFSHLENVSGNYVKLSERDERVYVLHQMPVAQTLDQIFRSVCLHGAPVMVCLSSTQDVEVKRCIKYWKGFQIVKKKTVISRSQKLKMRQLSYQGHQFMHLHLDLWKDEDNDPDPTLLFMLVEKFHKLIKRSDGVPFVHCSGGINRSRFFVIMHQVYAILQDDPNAKINAAELLMYSLLHRKCMSRHVLDWLKKYIPLMAQWMSRK